MPQKSDLWTEQNVARLKDLYLFDGHSRAEIAETLSLETGLTFTKNMVVGKLDRLGIRGLPRAQKERAAAPRVARAPKPEPALFMPASPAPLLELRPHQCRFPLGGPREPAVLFCAEPCHGNLSWCSHHLAVVAAPIPVRRAA